MGEYERDLEALRGLVAAEEVRRRAEERVCDWDDPVDRADYARAVRLAKRVARLDRLVPDRRCPNCKEVVPDPRAWVVSRRGALCRSCHQVIRRGASPGLAEGNEVVFPSVVRRYSLDPAALHRSRTSTGLSSAAFARRCGWSRAWQQRLEGRSGTPPPDVDEDTAARIQEVLNDLRPSEK